jgi:hypothetical protein
VRLPDGRFADHDIRAGRLTIYAFRNNFERARADEVYRRRGSFILKTPIVFTGSRDLVVTVPASERGRLRLDYGWKRMASRVRFEACARPGRATGYPGGLHYSGRWGRCVPLDVDGVGRILLPLGRRCRAQPL